MKRLLGQSAVLMMVVGVLGCSPEGTEESGAANGVYSSSLGAASAAASMYDLDGELHVQTNAAPVVSAAMMGQLKTGMAYAEVLKLIGQEPASISQEENPFSGVMITKTQWINGDLSHVVITFADDKLYAITSEPAP